MREIILASTSASRKMLLERLKIPFQCISPDIVEEDMGVPPDELASTLATLKAQAVAKQHPEAICIGGDQVPVCEGEILWKSGSPEQNRAQLKALSGKTVTFYSGLCITCEALEKSIVTVTPSVVTYRALSDAQIAHYVATEPAHMCAGGCQAEGLGISLLARVEATDPTALVGVSLIAVVAGLNAMGVDVLQS